MKRVLEAIEKRSSTRAFTAEPLSQEEINALIHAGLQAPTASNRQEIHFTIVRCGHPLLAELKEEVNRLKGTRNFHHDAPIVIFLSGDKNIRWSSLDAGIAVENIAIAAEGMGLGTLIIGIVYDILRGEKEDNYANILEFPSDYEFKVAIAVGHKEVIREPHTYEMERQVTWLKG